MGDLIFRRRYYATTTDQVIAYHEEAVAKRHVAPEYVRLAYLLWKEIEYRGGSMGQ